MKNICFFPIRNYLKCKLIMFKHIESKISFENIFYDSKETLKTKSSICLFKEMHANKTLWRLMNDYIHI